MVKTLKVLLVEDNVNDAELVLRQLRREAGSLDVTRVDTEEAFVEALDGAPDLILSDYDLGSFNGMRALEIIKARDMEVPFILISGTIGEDIAVEAIKLGASDYLLKDRLARLGTAVNHAIKESALRQARKQADTALMISESRYRLLVEQASDGIFTADAEGRHSDVNARGLEMIQYTREEFLRLRLGDLLAAGDRHRMITELEHLHKNQTHVAEFRIRRKDGTWFDAEISARALPDGHLLGIVRDLTERRRAERALRESEERFRQLAENINEVFWISDPLRGELLYISPAYETIWGHSRKDVYQRPDSWTDAIHPEDRERVIDAMSMQAGGGYHEIYRIIRPDGGLRWVRDRAFPIRDDNGRVYRVVGTAEDITEWRNLEEQFRQTQKLEAIGTLAGGIAHDFNNILGAIIGYIELTKAGLAQDAKTHRYLDRVLQGANRAAALVRQILAFSRQQDHQRVPVQLRHVISEPIELLRATIPAMIEFDVRTPSDLPVVLADPTQVHQVVMNLCTNAAHAMSNQSGTLTVALEEFLMDARKPELAGVRLKPGLYVRLTVSDTGCGMDRETQERIFEPFFTTKGPGDGTGLGLSVVHGIMQSHEGAVTVRSQPGEGTTFQLYFPAEGATEGTAVAAEKKPEIPKGGGERILFVDDEEPLAIMGQSILEALGYRAVAVSDVRDAIERVRTDAEGFDLVITDLSMPVMKGTDLAAHIQAQHPGMPVILTTGYTANLTDASVREMGISGLLLKPFNFSSLSTAVQRALAPSDRQ